MSYRIEQHNGVSWEHVKVPKHQAVFDYLNDAIETLELYVSRGSLSRIIDDSGNVRWPKQPKIISSEKLVTVTG